MGVCTLIFEQECIVFELLEILYLEQNCIKIYNANRNFDALSFRYESDTILSTPCQEIELQDDSICYVPSNINYTRNSKKDKLIVIHFKTFNYHSNNVECFRPENPEKYRNLFREILNCWGRKDIGYKNDSSALFSKILSELYKDNQPAGFKYSKIYNSILYIQQNYLLNDFSLSVAASKSFMSETYFRKLFKREFNISPKRYVVLCRIEYAKSLIIAGYYTVREVAQMCGYNDEKHFSSEFKKHTGVSPTNYCYNYKKD